MKSMANEKMSLEAKKRLDHELFRMRFGSWRALGWIGALIVLLAVACVRIPAQTHFALAEVTGVIALAGDGAPIQRIGVLLDGQDLTAGTRAQLLHPAKGEIVCIQKTIFWPFGEQRLTLTDMRFCNDTGATFAVD